MLDGTAVVAQAEQVTTTANPTTPAMTRDMGQDPATWNVFDHMVGMTSLHAERLIASGIATLHDGVLCGRCGGTGTYGHYGTCFDCGGRRWVAQ